MASAQTAAFQKAVVDSKKLTSKPSNEDLLDLYGVFPYTILNSTLCRIIGHPPLGRDIYLETLFLHQLLDTKIK